MAKTQRDEMAGGFEVRIGWRRDDAEIEADAIAFWNRTGILPPDVRPEDRAKEVLAAVYEDGRMIALATAHIEWIAELRARFVLVRAATDPEHRRRGAMRALGLPVRQTLERWAFDHQEEKVAGQFGYANAAWGELVKWPVAPLTGQIVAGYTAEGEQVRLVWYDHFRFDAPADGATPGPGETERRKVQMSEGEARAFAPDYDIHSAWRRDNEQFEADAIEFWNRLDILPPDVTAKERARELAAVAYKDGKLVAVTTIRLAEVKQVRARLGMLRAATDPEHRQSNVARALAVLTRAILERWAMEHPEEKVMGMGAVVQSEHLSGLEKVPVWPTTFLTLIGWTAKDQQLRVTWFEDARLD
jgi:GNAT superfamily N-acetyltransferase